MAVKETPAEVWTSPTKGEGGYTLSASVKKGTWHGIIVAQCGHRHATKKEAEGCSVDIPAVYDIELQSGDTARLIIEEI